MTLKELRSLALAGAHVSLEVHGVDASIYLVFQRCGERLIPVRDGSETARYRSRYSALKALADLGVKEVDFVHRSAYGEMIGIETPFEQTELRETIRIEHLQDP